MFWKKSKDKQSQDKSKGTTTTTTVYSTDDVPVLPTGSAITSFQSKFKSSPNSSSSKTTITISTKQTVSQKQNFDEVTRTYMSESGFPTLSLSPNWTLSGSDLNSPLMLSRQKTEPTIVRRLDATPFNSKYESPYRNANLPPVRTINLPGSSITTTTSTYQSPYRNTNATSSVREVKTIILSPKQTAISTILTPKTNKTTTIWNPMSSAETTRKVYSPLSSSASSLPAKTINPTPKTTLKTTIWNPMSSIETSKTSYTPKATNPAPFAKPISSVSKLPNVKPPPVSAVTSFVKPASKKKQTPGVVYIFHNDKFDGPDKEFRVGSVQDVRLLERTFKAYKMQVNLYENLTVRQINNAVQKIETKNFGDASCIVIVILTHGTRYETVAAKDGSYSIDDDVLFPILRNRSLQSKPKLLFIQACKGAMKSGALYKDSMQPNGPPVEILKCYSTFEGYVAYRTEKGSFFIQALCELLKDHGKSKNIKDIMDMVIRLVKERSENSQIPSYETTLTEPYIFGDYL